MINGLIDLLAQSPATLITVTLLLGLMLGSFLNVVIYRLPLMMEREWQEQCQALAAGHGDGGESTATAATPTFNLAFPPSRCPHCTHRIRWYENLPVVSYLALRGRCSACREPISIRYPSVELVTGLLSAYLAWQFSFGLPLLLVLLLTWALIALTLIDVDHQLLPDSITLPLLWLGLIANSFGLFTDLQSALWGAIAGYLSLWSVYWLFKLITGKEGMGYGDFKLLAALGAWMGWQVLPLIILLSSLVGAVIGVTLILVRGRDRNIPIPFGPYLAIAGWIALLWGEQITGAYLASLGV